MFVYCVKLQIFQIKIYFHDFTLNLFNLFGYLRKKP